MENYNSEILEDEEWNVYAVNSPVLDCLSIPTQSQLDESEQAETQLTRLINH